MKCKFCGKEITRTDRSTYCSLDCSLKANRLCSKIRLMIQSTAKKYKFNIENVEKIINAKFLLFKNDNIKKCPCDADNPERYCGSALCIHDVIEYGHCHCNLFHKKVLAKDEK